MIRAICINNPGSYFVEDDIYLPPAMVRAH